MDAQETVVECPCLEYLASYDQSNSFERDNYLLRESFFIDCVIE